MTRLYALDMGSLFAWQYFAHAEEVDGGLLGVNAWWLDFVHHLAPTHVVACLDAGHARRAAVDPEYKISRKTKPKDEVYIDQIRRLPETLTEIGIPWLRESGEEADDVIGSVVTQYASSECEVIVVSTDKDLSCLVGDHCRRYDPKPNKAGECLFYDVDAVTAKMGVPPWRLTDLLSIMGDSSDDIKGIVGIGEKQALAALQQTKSMSELFRKAAASALANLKPSSQAKIAAGRAEYEHARKLVELRCDIPIPALDTFALSKAVAA